MLYLKIEAKKFFLDFVLIVFIILIFDLVSISSQLIKKNAGKIWKDDIQMEHDQELKGDKVKYIFDA